MEYLPLHVHSDYSIGDSILGVDEYANWAKENNFKSISITDHGSLCGSLIFNQVCLKKEIKPVIGLESYCLKEENFKDKDSRREHLILIAKNKNGYNTLLRLHGKSMRDSFYYKPVLFYENLFDDYKDLIISTACGSGFVGQSIIDNNEKAAITFINFMKEIFGEDFYLEAMETEIKEQRKINDWIFRNYKKLGVKGIWTTDSHYLREDLKEVHDAMIMINRKLTYNDPKIKEKLYSSRNLYLKTRKQILEELEKIKEYQYDLKIINEFLDNTLEIDSKISSYKLTTHETIMPSWGKDSFEVLKKLSKKALEEKGLSGDKVYIDRLEMELDVIKEKKMQDYFLIVSDIVKYAENNGIMSGVGRGCFLPNSEITLENGNKEKIKSIKKGSVVFSGYGNKKEVKEVFEYEIDEKVCQIILKNGDVVGEGNTLDHELFVIPKEKEKKIENAIWIRADKIRPGDFLVKNYDQNKIF